MLRHCLHVPKHTHTPKHRPKCTLYGNTSIYIFFFRHPTVYRETKEIPILTTPTLHPESKEPKSAIQKWTLVSYTLYLFNNINGVILLFVLYQSLR